MGNTLKKFRGIKEVQFLMIGLDSGGKTTLLYRMKTKTFHKINMPTIAYNKEVIKHGKLEIKMYDAVAYDFRQQAWNEFFPDTDCLIFVVDSTDTERLDKAREALMKALSHPDLEDTILLVFANKQDLPEALSAAEISSRLQLDQIKNTQWNIQGVSAVSGEGITEGLNWAESVLNNK